MSWLTERKRLGRTGLLAGRLGLGSSYFAPEEAFLDAYDAGCNLFYWGALRTPGMTKAMRTIVARGERDGIIVMVQVYVRPGGLDWSLTRGLKRLGIEAADILLLGWRNNTPDQRTLDQAEGLREKGAFRYLGISGHQRPLFASLGQDKRFDIFMVRYNAANRGAEEDIFPHLPADRPGMVGFTATRWGQLMKSKKIPPEEKRPKAGDCYRFVLCHPSMDVVITGPSNSAQMKENLREVSKGLMSAEELAWMRRIGDYVYGRPPGGPLRR